jgi:hypothetical protein
MLLGYFNKTCAALCCFLWVKAKVITKASSKKNILKNYSTMLMKSRYEIHELLFLKYKRASKYFLCYDLGGMHKLCGMEKLHEKMRFQNYPL